MVFGLTSPLDPLGEGARGDRGGCGSGPGAAGQAACGSSQRSGVFGGAVPKSALEAAVNSVPDEDLPLPKAAILGFMNLLENDIDSTGDGTKDALSLGLKVSGIDAIISGVK